MPQMSVEPWTPQDLPPGWAYRAKPYVTRDWSRTGDPLYAEETRLIEVEFHHASGVAVEMTLYQQPDPVWLRTFLDACLGIHPAVQVTAVWANQR